MTVTIELSPEVEARLRSQADEQGKPVSDYLRSMIENLIAPSKEIDINAFLALPRDEQDRFLASAAEDAAPLYAADLNKPVMERELTAFTALDGEPFLDDND